MTIEIRPGAGFDAFRSEVRAFLRSAASPELRRKVREGWALSRDDLVGWQKTLARHGWGAPGWPVEAGGTGWTDVEQLIFIEESYFANVPPVHVFNITMLGPVIHQFGTAAQRERWLNDLLFANVWFCQGFSEPGSGSDLASLSTRAERSGDGYLVNGAKIWTSYAQYADWIFCLVRTDPAARKQQGISMLLIDMKTPGVTVRPIISIDGRHSLNEVFFDNVRVPAENLVGEPNKGWDYAKFLLGNERASIAGIARSKERLNYSMSLVAEPDAAMAARAGMLAAELDALEVVQYRVLTQPLPAADRAALTSGLKLKGTELYKQVMELMLEIAGAQALRLNPRGSQGSAGSPASSGRHALAEAHLYTRSSSIVGGTNEIQKSILSRHIYATVQP